MNSEAKHELKDLAQDLTYNYIKHSGLARLISNEDWDQLAEQLANQTLILVDRLVDEELTKLEAEAQGRAA